MYIDAIDSLGLTPIPLKTSSYTLPRVDVGGIYTLSTNGVVNSTSTVDYGISPCQYRKLPNESLVLLTIHADPPVTDLPLMLAVPDDSSSTVVSFTSKTVPIVDSKNTQVTSNNVVGNTQRLVYINKCKGIVRFVEFTNQTA